MERKSLLIRKSIDVLESENNVKIKEISSKAKADAYEIEQTAEATGIQNKIDAEVKVTSAIKTDLTFVSKDL